VEYFGGLLLDTEVYHIPMEATGKEETAIGIFQYDIREAAPRGFAASRYAASVSMGRD